MGANEITVETKNHRSLVKASKAAQKKYEILQRPQHCLCGIVGMFNCQSNISKTTFFILVQGALVALTNLSSEAYFCPASEQSAIPVIIQCSKTGMPTMASSVLAMSNSQEVNEPSSAGVGHRSMNQDRHVYACYLPVVEIVTQQSHRYMPSEFSIESLLYANLKLEKLIYEYEGLKRKSKSILKGLDVPYLYGSRNFNNLIEKKNDGLNQSINRVANQTISLAGPLANSNRLKKRRDFSVSANGNRTATKHQLTFERRAISYSPGDASRVDPPPQDKAGSPLRSAPDQVEPVQNFQYGVQQEEGLPWMSRALRSFGKYLRENKVEAIIFILFFLIAHQLIFSSRK